MKKGKRRDTHKHLRRDTFVRYASRALGALALLIIGAFLGHYLSTLEPDIRLTKAQRPDALTFLDYRVNEDGDFVFLISLRLRVKNIGWRSGFIDKVEFVPLAIETIPRIEIKHIDKRPLGWRAEQNIEVRALITVRAGFVGPALEKKTVSLEVKAFDNHGHVVDRYDDGMFARVRYSLNGEIKRILKLLPA
jgi:hypothetical protein